MKGTISNKKGLLALSPLIVFLLLYLFLSLAADDFYAVPLTVAFLVASLYSLLIIRGQSISQRFGHLAEGAAAPGVMQMLWIFILAGAFAATAKQMGAIDATIRLALTSVPPSFVLSSLFLASCFISLATGTSVGTIAALAPIAGNMASQTGSNTAMMVAIVVGGAYFGDNLSFISDTTIVATQTQGCEMKDKFRANIWIALPAALICLALYACMPAINVEPDNMGEVFYPAIIPYIYYSGGALRHECDARPCICNTSGRLDRHCFRHVVTIWMAESNERRHHGHERTHHCDPLGGRSYASYPTSWRH